MSMISRVDIFTVFAIELPYPVDVLVVGLQGLNGRFVVHLEQL